jgi:hypothetical protein
MLITLDKGERDDEALLDPRGAGSDSTPTSKFSTDLFVQKRSVSCGLHEIKRVLERGSSTNPLVKKRPDAAPNPGMQDQVVHQFQPTL